MTHPDPPLESPLPPCYAYGYQQISANPVSKPFNPLRIIGEHSEKTAKRLETGRVWELSRRANVLGLTWNPVSDNISKQGRNQGRDRGVKTPPRKIFDPPGKMCWTSFKTTGHSSKNLAPPRKLFAPPGVPSWLQACIEVSECSLS